MSLSNRENWLRAITFKHPEWIPCGMGFSLSNWQHQKDDLLKLIARHPKLWPDFDPATRVPTDRPVVYRQGEYFTDNWGCTWWNIQEGYEGQVVGYPLADWSALATYKMPDPRTQSERSTRDWAKTARDVAEAKAKGQLVGGDGERLFDRMYFLRGWENLMMDFATEPPELDRLIAMLTDYELRLVDLSLDLGVDTVGFHTDIGTQKALMISPASFRKHVKPMFKTVFQHCHDRGALVTLSSDGCVLEIVDDLIECGVNMHDPQLRANGLENIARAYKGKMCVTVDTDRQGYAFDTPADLRREIKEVVDVMAEPEGGLMVGVGVYDENVPMDNLEALAQALEDYCLAW
jgi:uroporphyrinogen decarboxylase